MSVAPPPVYPTWPPQPPSQVQPRRRWIAPTVAALGGAVVGGLVATMVTLAATTPDTSTVSSAPSTVTETASPPAPPAPLPVADANAQTCQAWLTTDDLVTAAAAAIPPGVDFNDPATAQNPVYKAAYTRAADMLSQAADTLEAQTAAGTSPILAQVAETTVGSLRTMSATYRSFDPATGNANDVFLESQKALDWLCQ